jgi:hypothetical protein
MNQKYNLPRFKKEMKKFAKVLPVGTHWRYSNGILPPPFGQLLVENPELALALAADAADLAKQRIVIEGEAKKRGRKRSEQANSAQQGDDTAQLGLL